MECHLEHRFFIKILDNYNFYRSSWSQSFSGVVNLCCPWEDPKHLLSISCPGNIKYYFLSSHTSLLLQGLVCTTTIVMPLATATSLFGASSTRRVVNIVLTLMALSYYLPRGDMPRAHYMGGRVFLIPKLTRSSCLIEFMSVISFVWIANDNHLNKGIARNLLKYDTHKYIFCSNPKMNETRIIYNSIILIFKYIWQSLIIMMIFFILNNYEL